MSAERALAVVRHYMKRLRNLHSFLFNCFRTFNNRNSFSPQHYNLFNKFIETEDDLDIKTNFDKELVFFVPVN